MNMVPVVASFFNLNIYPDRLCLYEDPFIENMDDVDDEVTRRNHAQLDSTLHFDAEERSPEEIARAVARRHRDRAAPYTGDMNEIPQRLLMPSVHDASLWQVRVKVCHFLFFIFTSY
jgi:Spt5 transcription elongation factor, acidic N-terminal